MPLFPGAKIAPVVAQLGLCATLAVLKLASGTANAAPPQRHKIVAPTDLPHAVVVDRVDPEYTPEAREAGLEGIVVLYVEISASGKLEKAAVVQRLGMGLDEKALEAVKRWRFVAATNAGLPAASQQSVEVPFSLHQTTSSWRVRRSFFRIHHKFGGDLDLISHPRLLHYTSPDLQVCGSEQTNAIVDIDLTKEGRVAKTEMVAQTNQAVGDAVIKAIAGCTFLPDKNDGKPAPGYGVVELECQPARVAASLPADSPEPLLRESDPGVSMPKLLYSLDPEYAEEARHARKQGKVLLAAEIDSSGRVVDIVVMKPLAMGLDEKAMESVFQWRFQPAVKNGNQELSGPPLKSSSRCCKLDEVINKTA